MNIEIRRVDYEEVKALHELYRQEANCQIIHDSFLVRGLADPYLILVEGRLAGYAAIGNKYPPGQLTEFYTLPPMRPFALPICRELLAASGATRMEAQTNMPMMLLLLYDCTRNIFTEALLFEDAFTTHLTAPNAVFRQIRLDESDAIFQHKAEPLGEWMIEVDGAVVATGGFLTHYNPPYGDIYMEVDEPARKQGYGSYLVQEVKRVCYEAGKKPAARTSPDNIASRQTLQKAGLLPCGYLLIGEVSP